MTAYYNENDPSAAAVLRELIAQGHIARGDVDTRSIKDVVPTDLRGYTQCHFFAGIGGWSLALRLAGWPNDRRVWTGSCPCQPFSSAGRRDGFADERHLWPAWFHLIQQCRPPVVLGEQVASSDGLRWLDLVCADLEGQGYAFGAADLCAAGVGAPHMRQRLWFVGMADADDSRPEGWSRAAGRSAECLAGASGLAGRLADLHSDGRESRREGCAAVGHGQAADADCGAGGVGDAGRELQASQPELCGGAPASGSRSASIGPARPTDVHWRAADWLYCRDGKWRPVEPGTFPLAHGLPARVGRLRGYGNAIVPQVAATFVRAVMA